VLVTAAVFGMVHPYTTAGLVQVGMIGIVFGLLREWRGSLIAPMVAHALHNGTIAFTTVMIMAAID
jgi:membrane protease YdiL (CAAX protease family)